MTAREPYSAGLDNLVSQINRVNLQRLDDVLWYCDRRWPRCKPSLDRMIPIRDRIQMAVAEINKCF